MKWLKRILLALLILVVLFVCVGFVLPGSYKVERSITINAKPEIIYKPLSDLKTWNDWTAWNDRRFPDMKTKISGPDSGAGAAMEWTGKDVGDGAIKLTKADPAEGIEYDLDVDNGQLTAKGRVKMKIVGDKVEVTWSNSGDLGWNPVSRYFGLLMDSFMGSDLEFSLRNLKGATEIN